MERTTWVLYIAERKQNSKGIAGNRSAEAELKDALDGPIISKLDMARKKEKGRLKIRSIETSGSKM